MPPAVGSCRGDVEGGCSGPQRETTLDRGNQGDPTGQSELGVSVQVHSAPSFERRSGKTHSLKGGAG